MRDHRRGAEEDDWAGPALLPVGRVDDDDDWDDEDDDWDDGWDDDDDDWDDDEDEDDEDDWDEILDEDDDDEVMRRRRDSDWN